MILVSWTLMKIGLHDNSEASYSVKCAAWLLIDLLHWKHYGTCFSANFQAQINICKSLLLPNIPWVKDTFHLPLLLPQKCTKAIIFAITVFVPCQEPGLVEGHMAAVRWNNDAQYNTRLDTGVCSCSHFTRDSTEPSCLWLQLSGAPVRIRMSKHLKKNRHGIFIARLFGV